MVQRTSTCALTTALVSKSFNAAHNFKSCSCRKINFANLARNPRVKPPTPFELHKTLVPIADFAFSPLA